MYRSPSWHGRSSSVSRSGSRSSMYRSPSMTTFSAGYMRSPSTIFGRALESSAYYRTPPLHSVAVQRSTPHWSDKYPYVRYSYGSTAHPGLGLITSSSSVRRDHYSQRDRPVNKYLESSWNMYGTSLRLSPSYGVSSPRLPARNYTRYMPVDDAVSMYQKRCMTVGTLSKYWLSPTTWQSRRQKEYNLGRSAADGTYSYYSRYSGSRRFL